MGRETGGPANGGHGGEAPTGDGIALFDSNVPPDQDQSAWLEPGEMLDPTSLVVAVSSTPLTCDKPDFQIGSVTHTLVLVGLPEAMQKVGTYDLASTDVVAWGSSWLSDGMGNGGGADKTLTTGSVEIVSLDATAVHLELAGLSGDFQAANGPHVAVRCAP